MGAKKQLEQNKREQPVSIISRTLTTGFFGGLFWSFIAWMASYFHFTTVSPATFVIRAWLDADWTNTWLADVLSILTISVISILVALVYYILLRKTRGLLPSILFGLLLWGVVFYALLPIFPNIKPLSQLDSDTIVTTICLFLLYGIFIGYSISYDYLDTITKKNI
ncbi:YqhR family membrane protein [Paraliobacillus sp. JSM ZJ581]|uniref:YqhR family membrane protein n=1 Tax=Paraliobacillus sp. JSM ZJ581 TaxID=3342118 RepID=UPI0035A8762F